MTLARTTNAHERLPFSIRILNGLESSNYSATSSLPNSQSPCTQAPAQPGNTPSGPAARNNDDVSSLLPASFRTKKDSLAVPDLENLDMEESFLREELNVQRLNKIHKWLWLAGRPMPPRALHRQKLLGRDVLVAEQMDMHLLWLRSQMFIKPVPRFLLQSSFWDEHLKCKPGCACSKGIGVCNRHELWSCALGFMLSYVALVAHESDFSMAKDIHLLPREVTWDGWRVLVKQLLEDTDIYHHVNRRFLYGELRLDRLNLLYRLTGRSVLRGYRMGYGHYSDFFRDNFGWLASIFAYMAIVLTAMQVGLGTEQLRDDVSFNAASYGFTVFSIVAPLVVLLVIVLLLGVLVVNNWVATLRFKETRFEHMGTSGEMPVDEKGPA